MYYHTVKKFKQGKFDVVLSWKYEDISIRDCFDDTCHDIAEMERKVDAGYLDWFVARVQFFYNGVEVGASYLGGCLYEDVDKAFEDGLDGYLEDMIAEAEAEAIMYIGDMISNLKQDFPNVVNGVKV